MYTLRFMGEMHSEQEFFFRKMLNLKRSTWYCEKPLYSPGYLQRHLSYFIVSYLGYIYKRRRPRTFLNA